MTDANYFEQSAAKGAAYIEAKLAKKKSNVTKIQIHGVPGEVIGTPAYYAEFMTKPGAEEEAERDKYRNEVKQVNIYNSVTCHSLNDFLNIKIPEREILLSPWLPRQSLSMLYAWRGIGKSWLALSIGYAVACGGEILGWQSKKKHRVLYIDGELPALTLQERLSLIVKSFDSEPDENGFKLITPDMQPDGIVPNLSDPVGRESINSHTENVDLIIVDNLSTLALGGRENESESWLPIQRWALQHRAQGRSILFIHHSGKGGQQRGTSRKEDVLDTVISLRRPPEYESTEGARFELHFEKARNLTGDDALPLEVELCTDDGVTKWKYKQASDAILERIQMLAEDGASRKEIQDELGLSRFQLARLIKKAAESGVRIAIKDARKG